ncbi:DUF4397 domain-containing protein [Haloarchaeobius sp. DT45]|uniref:DUF4397 domain-containing protein n=1 Tax=Haloarchaeobius sp. DT45 TaxID=3446116 RepID=UPI003F6DA051
MVATRRTVLQSVGIVGGTLAIGGVGVEAVLASYHEAADEEAAGGLTEVRIIHASPNAPAVDVIVDGETVLTDVQFGTVSDYLTLEAGEHDIVVTRAGMPNEVVLSQTTELEEGKFTIMAIGEIGTASFEPKAFEDMVTAPAEDEVSIRAIHASPDAPAVDVVIVPQKDDLTADDITVIQQVSFGSATDYLTLEPGPYFVDVYPAIDPGSPPEQPPSPVATAEVDLQGGHAYSGIGLGYLEPEEDQPGLELKLAIDAVIDEDAPVEEEVPFEEGEEVPFEEGEEVPFEEGEEVPFEEGEEVPVESGGGMGQFPAEGPEATECPGATAGDSCASCPSEEGARGYYSD